MKGNLTENRRILSLDVFRGLTIALMILVNSLGTQISYPILDHAEWNGYTLADFVFPAFLFIVGITIVVSLTRHLHEESKFQVYKSILKRSLLLFGVGILLNMYPKHFDFATLRFYGVLQRIAICYFIGAILCLTTSSKTQFITFCTILFVYWYFLTQVPLPTPGIDQLSMSRNWVGYIDSTLFSPAHLLRKTFDPEGLLSTLPAVATTLAGLLTGQFLMTSISKPKKSLMLLLAGILCLILAWVWSYSFPMNKNLWTSTYVLWSSGLSLLVFALCFWIIDVLGYSKWALPFKIFGMNALFIFIFHVVILKTLAAIFLTSVNGTQEAFRFVVSEYLFGSLGAQNAGVLYALLFLLFNFAVATVLYRRKIFIKI